MPDMQNAEELPDELAVRMGLKPRVLDPGRFAAMPNVPAPAMPTGSGLNPATLDLGPGPTNARVQPPSPGGLPDPRDPIYNPGPRHGVLPTLGAIGMGVLGGFPAAESYLNAPQVNAQKQYQQDRQHAMDVNTQEDTEAQAAQRKALADKALREPPEKPEDVMKQYSDALASGNSAEADRLKPLVQQYLSVTKPPQDKPDTATEEDQKYEKIQQAATLKQPVTPEDKAWASAYEKRKTLTPLASASLGAGDKRDARSDRSYQYNQNILDKTRTPIEQLNGRLSNLSASIGQGTPQADALIAPELLSIMAGGQGSGLRMNESEISRIVGGRSNWESLQAAVNKWKTDPNSANSITPAQRAQIKALAGLIQGKVSSKLSALQDAEDSLLGADDPKEHRRIVADTKKKLDSVDSGAAGAPGGGGGGKVLVEGKDF